MCIRNVQWQTIAGALVLMVAVGVGLLPDLFGTSSHGYSTSTASNQRLLRQLSKAQCSGLQGLLSWLVPPPGGRYKISIPSSRDEGATPVIKLNWACQWICMSTKFPKVVDSKCVACLTLFSLPTWAHGTDGKPNPPLARLPVYEGGFTALAAIPLLYPRRWATADLLRGFGLTDYAATAEAQTLANDNWQGGVKPSTQSWTINGVTRPVVSKMRAAVPPACVEVLGWITPAGAPMCPDTNNVTDVDVHFPDLDAVGSDALPLSYGFAEDYRAISRELTREAFASAKHAATATIDTMQTAYSTTIFFRNVTSKQRLKELSELYGAAEWDPLSAEKIAADGDLVEVDLLYPQGVKSTAPPVPGHESDGEWWNVAAHALYRVVGGGNRLVDLAEFESSTTANEASSHSNGPVPLSSHSISYEPVAILLSNQPSDPAAKLVYTPAKSESAYILASLALRQAASQTAIWVGHVYNLHIHSVATTVALYNTIDPQKNVYYSTHPVRQILDFFADPTYVSEFHSTLFAAGYTAGPGTAAGVPDLLSLWNAYAVKGVVHNDTSWAGSTVPEQLVASGLSEERFRGVGEKGRYSELPGVAFNLALRRKVTAPYAKSIVHAAYASDKEVAADTQLQAFAAALVAPHGANLGRINADGNKLETRAQLAKFIEDFVSIVLTHGSAHLQDYSMRVLNVALNPPRLGHQTAPDPTSTYTTDDYMRWIPTTTAAARQYTFVANFVGTTMLPATTLVASQQSIQGAAPSWGDGTPYYTGRNADVVQSAHEEFIRKASEFMATWPRSPGLRAVATNFQSPTRLPRAINI